MFYFSHHISSIFSQEFLRGEHDSGDFEYSPTHDGSWGASYGSSSASQAGQSSGSRNDLEESADHHGEPTVVNPNSETNRSVFEECQLPINQRKSTVSSRSHNERSDIMDFGFEDYAEEFQSLLSVKSVWRIPETHGFVNCWHPNNSFYHSTSHYLAFIESKQNRSFDSSRYDSDFSSVFLFQ